MPSLTSKLSQVYKRYVMYDENEMDKNKRIAEDVVNGFKRFLQNEKSTEVFVLKQGSSFEGIKVGRPDEFDFLLVFDYGSTVTAREARNAPGRWTDRDKLAGHWQLTCSYPDRYCDGQYLSTEKFHARFQTFINAFVTEIRRGRYVQGIRYATQEYASVGNPALTLVVEKSGGRPISIDMSICIKVTVRGWISNSYHYYIAKQHHCDHSNTFWLVMNSQKELEFFASVPQEIKIRYRIFKFLLRNKIHNTYVIKTAFIYVYQETSNNDLENDIGGFCSRLLVKLKTAYEKQYLGAYFNQSENILRSSPGALINNAGWLRRLCNKPIDDTVDELIDHALPRMQLEALVEAAVEEDRENASWWCIVM